MKDSITRYPIVELPNNRSRKGSKLVVYRNFLIGRENYQRVTQHEKLHIKIKLQQVSSETIVFIRSNHSGAWEEYALEQKDENSFEQSLVLQHIGIFQFKIRYSINGGKSWLWDNVPYSSIFVETPLINNLKMYTLIPNISGSFKMWIEHLHRIKLMGFNAIHLLPVTHMDSSESPYAAFDLFAVDPSFLNPGDGRDGMEQFEEFVQEARLLGIKLCFDIVLNHIGVTSLMASKTPNWIVTDGSEDDGLKRAGCWDGADWVSWNDIALIEYDHPDKKIQKNIWKYMTSYLLFWANYAEQTGGMVRLDNLHSTNRSFFDCALTSLNSHFPNLTVFAELFTDLNTISKMVFHHQIQLLLATPWVTPFTAGYRSGILNLHANKHKFKYLFPVNSHDSKSVPQLYGSAAALVPRYALSLLLGTGSTGMVQGAEFGVSSKVEFVGRNKNMDSCSDNYSDQLQLLHSIFDDVTKNELVSSIYMVDQGHESIIAAVRFIVEADHQLLVIANLDTENTQEIILNFTDLPFFISDKITLECLFGNPKCDIEHTNLASPIYLGAASVQVYRFEI